MNYIRYMFAQDKESLSNTGLAKPSVPPSACNPGTQKAKASCHKFETIVVCKATVTFFSCCDDQGSLEKQEFIGAQSFRV